MGSPPAREAREADPHCVEKPISQLVIAISIPLLRGREILLHFRMEEDAHHLP